MEEAPSGSSVDGEPEGGAVNCMNVENEMDEIQHYHNTIYIYICIDYCVMHIHCKNLLSIILLYLTPDYFTLSNTRRFTHQGESECCHSMG
jgi:hypothetical protein